MRSFITLTFFVMIFFTSIGQTNSFGRISADTLILNNGARFVKGEKIQFGTGSNGDKGFEFVYTSPFSLSGLLKIGSGWSNSTMQIKKFKEYGTKKTGQKFYILLAGANITTYWCDIIPAMENGEVIVDGINDKATLTKKNQPTRIVELSIADELIKLKKLYDDGVLTKEEYEAQKKKLLDR